MTFRAYRDVLPSGLTVVTVETPHLHAVNCSVHVRVGSRHETPENNGVSHLLEHLFFRGSARWPDSVRMNAAVEAVGGNLNGVTMRDASIFYTPAHPDGVGVALSILGDMLSRPRLTHLDTEKRIILEEMLDEVDERGRDIDVDNLAKRLLFGKHPLAYKIAGTPDTVRAMTLSMVRRHYERFYVTGNIVVSVGGPVRRKDVVKLATRAFARLREGPRIAEQPPAAAPRTGPRVKFVSLEESQVEFRVSFPGVPENDPDSMALSMLRRVLDDGLSSRLPYNIVEKRGLAYSIGATLEAFHDAGAFEIDGAAAPKQLAPVIEEVLRTLSTLRAGKIGREELVRAQRRFRMHLDFLQDSPADLCGWFGGVELYRPPEKFEDKCREAEAMTVAELTRAARKYLDPQAMAVIAVGPRSSKRALERVVARAGKLLR